MPVFAIRSLGIDPVADHLARQLEKLSGEPPIFVCDARNGAPNTGPYAHLAMTDDSLSELGLTDLPDDWGWLCGDMCYYTLAYACPKEDQFILIESDVYIPDTALTTLKSVVERPEQALATHLKRHDAPKKFSRGLEPMGFDPNWGCIFPVSIVQRSVIETMKSIRQRTLAEQPTARINDEAILAAAVQSTDASFADLAHIAPDLFAPDSFDTNPPHLFEAVQTEDTAKIFHPVVTFDTVKARMLSGEKAYSKHRLRRILATAPKSMKKEIKTILETKGE